MASMDSHVKKGIDIQSDISKGVETIQEMGKEFQGVKDALQGMPGGLDADLTALIQNVETQGKSEVTADIESTKSSVIDQAKTTADTLKSDVTTKIGENTTARGKLDGITSKYGKDAVSQAKTAIDANSQKGQDLIKDLEAAIQKADSDVQTVKGNI